MDVKIDLNAEEIQAHIVKTITDSVIGKEIAKTIKELVISEASFGRQKIIQTTVERHVKEVVTDIIRNHIEQHREKIREVITSKITDEFLMATTEKFFDFWTKDMR